MARKIGYCQVCGEPVSMTQKYNVFGGAKPNYADLNGKVFHNSETRNCWEKFQKGIKSHESKGLIRIESPTQNAPLGKVTIERKF